MVVAVLLGVSGLLMLLSAFFAWVEGLTGWRLMFETDLGRTSNMLFSADSGLLIFSGFWALLFGVLVMAGALVLLLDQGPGGALAVTSGVLGLILSVVTIAMMYANDLTAGPGVFVFGVFSLMSVILGITAIAERRYWTDRSYYSYYYS